MTTINALAVLDLVICGEEWRHLFSLDQVCQSRAAVADLVEAASNPVILEGATDGNWQLRMEAIQRLRAAIAKVA